MLTTIEHRLHGPERRVPCGRAKAGQVSGGPGHGPRRELLPASVTHLDRRGAPPSPLLTSVRATVPGRVPAREMAMQATGTAASDMAAASAAAVPVESSSEPEEDANFKDKGMCEGMSVQNVRAPAAHDEGRQ